MTTLLVTKKQAAEALSICPATLDRLVRAGVVIPTLLGKRAMFALEELKRVASPVDRQTIKAESHEVELVAN